MSSSKQRSGGGDSTGRTASRRTFLGLLGSAGVVGAAGCLGAASSAVRVLSAGSLAQTFEAHVGPAFEDDTGVTVYGEYHGSNAVMRMVEDRTTHPDVIVSADVGLLRNRLYGEYTEWDVEFATNSLGLAYNPQTTFGQRIEDGAAWYKLARDTDDGDIAIGDPDLDPLGYRALQAFELAEREHGLDGFREAMRERVYLEPEEPQLLAGVDSGARSGAVVYRNMAVDHEIPFVEFPDAYNFGNPGLADHYATVEYTIDEEGYTATGRPIVYSATVNETADAPDEATRLVQFLIDNPHLLDEAGLTVGEQLPRPHGTLPETLVV